MINKKIHLIFAMLLCFIMLAACVQHPEPRNTSVLQTSHYELGKLVASDSVEMQAKVDSVFKQSELDSFLVDYSKVRKKDSLLTKDCSWYCLKTLVEYEEAVECSVLIDIPSTSFCRMNVAIRKSLNKYKEDFLKHLHEIDVLNNPFRMDGIYSDFRAHLISAFQDSQYVSFCFRISDYAAGSVHGMHQYETFNFEKSSGKRIIFSDLFSVDSASDSVLMCDLITESIGMGPLDHISVYDYDFNLNDKYIVLNFDAYEVGSYAFGTPRAALDRKAMFERFGKS
ncbi:MAG: hypothetical protein ACFHU9_06805 [Fluviicola sp.]